MTFSPPALRPLGVAAGGLAAVIVALTWLFSIRYRLYIPAFFGVRRLFDYSSIPVVIAVLALIEWALAAWGARRPAAMVAAASILAIGALLIPTSRSGQSAVARDGRVAAAFNWIRTNVPCDARILPDAHTEGVFEAFTGRVSLLEGATPYLRPVVRTPVIRLLLSTRRFFRNPAENLELLKQLRVDFVVLVRSPGLGYHGPVATGDPAVFNRSPAFEPVYNSSEMLVYRVISPASPSRIVQPSSFPGYRCQRVPARL
jgi:hypothetical protein